MFKISIAAAALATTLVAVPAFAAEPEVGSFTYEGVKYDYTVEQKGDVKVLKGSPMPARCPSNCASPSAPSRAASTAAQSRLTSRK